MYYPTRAAYFTVVVSYTRKLFIELATGDYGCMAYFQTRKPDMANYGTGNSEVGDEAVSFGRYETG